MIENEENKPDNEKEKDDIVVRDQEKPQEDEVIENKENKPDDEKEEDDIVVRD